LHTQKKKFQYLDKRSPNGELLKNIVFKKTLEKTKESMLILKSYKIIDNLSDQIDKKYLSYYLEKVIFYELLPIVNQIVILEYDNPKSDIKKTIDIGNFFCPDLLKKIFSDSYNFKYSNTRTYIFNGLFKPLFLNLRFFFKFSLKVFFNLFYPYKLNTPENVANSLAVKFINSDMADPRSERGFYINNLEYFTKYNTHIYFDNNSNDYLFLKEYISQNHITNVNLIILNFFKIKQNNLYFDFFKKILFTSSSDKIESALLSISKNLLIKLSMYYSFFNDYKIKIHIDSTEQDPDTIIKLIAINKIGGLSVGKMRSNFDNINSRFFGYYPNDIFFTWGDFFLKNILSKNYLTTNFKINSIIIAGYYYQISNKNLSENELITKKFDNQNINYTILFLDTNHDSNLSHTTQVVETKHMLKIIEIFSNILNTHSNIGVIYKSKKSKFLKNLFFQNDNMIKLNNRFHIVNDADNINPSSFIHLSDLVVSITARDIPSAFLECVISDNTKKFILYDYNNMFSFENEFYKIAQNKIIFNNINSFASALNHIITYKNSDLGLWPINDLEKLDSFNDNNGIDRFAFYINHLIDNFNNKLSSDQIIEFTNLEYKKKFGNDKVIKC
jgi:hypothetical protein